MDADVARAARVWVEQLESRVLLSAGTIKVVITDQYADSITNFRFTPTGPDPGGIYVRSDNAEAYFVDDRTTDFVNDVIEPHQYARQAAKFYVELIRNRDAMVVDSGHYLPGTEILRTVTEPGSYRVRVTVPVQIDELATENTGSPTRTTPSWKERQYPRPPSQLLVDDPTKGAYEFARIERRSPTGGWAFDYTKRYTYMVTATSETYVDAGETDQAFVCLPIGDKALVQSWNAPGGATSLKQAGKITETLSNLVVSTALESALTTLLKKVGASTLSASLASAVISPAISLNYLGLTPNADLGDYIAKYVPIVTSSVALASLSYLGAPAAATTVLGIASSLMLDQAWSLLQEDQLRQQLATTTADDLVVSRDTVADTVTLYNSGGELRNVRLILADKDNLHATPSRSTATVPQVIRGQKVDFSGVAPFFLADDSTGLIPMIEFDRPLNAGFKSLTCRVPWTALSPASPETGKPSMYSARTFINSGLQQRAHIDRVDVAFSEYLPAPLPLSALKLFRNGTEEISLSGAYVTTTTTDEAAIDLRFVAMPDGQYDLRIDPTKATDWFGNTLVAGAAPYTIATFSKLAGDANGDQTVDSKDLLVWKKSVSLVGGAYQSTPGQINYDPNAEMTFDDKVDIYDKDIITANMGHTLLTPAKLVVEEASGTANDNALAFGSVGIGMSPVTIPVTLRNTGGRELVISALAIQGAGAAQFSLPGGTGGFKLAANASQTIQVKFSPSQIGSFTGTLLIYSNDSASPASVNLAGDVTQEFRVNSEQVGYNGRTSVAMDAQGNFVVLWTDDTGSGSDDGHFVRMRHYSIEGKPLDDERVLIRNATTQLNCQVKMAPSGWHYVFWGLINSAQWFVQRYDPQGRPIGNQFTMNTTGLIDFTVSPSGGWDLIEQRTTDNLYVLRRFSVNGLETSSLLLGGSEFSNARITYAADGGLIVVYVRSTIGTRCRVFAPDETMRSDYLISNEVYGVRIVQDWNNGSAIFSNKLYRLSPDGLTVRSMLTLPTWDATFGSERWGSVTDDAGNLLLIGVIADSYYNRQVFGRTYDANGASIGGPWQLSTQKYEPSWMSNWAFASNNHGQFVPVWGSLVRNAQGSMVGSNLFAKPYSRIPYAPALAPTADQGVVVSASGGGEKVVSVPSAIDSELAVPASGGTGNHVVSNPPVQSAPAVQPIEALAAPSVRPTTRSLPLARSASAATPVYRPSPVARPAPTPSPFAQTPPVRPSLFPAPAWPAARKIVAELEESGARSTVPRLECGRRWL